MVEHLTFPISCVGASRRRLRDKSLRTSRTSGLLGREKDGVAK